LKIITMTVSRVMYCLPVVVLVFTGCVSYPEPIEAPMLTTDSVELFRRTRFQELAASESESNQKWIKLLSSRRALSSEHLAILEYRRSYALGDADQMKVALNKISPRRPAHRLFSAIMANIEPSETIRNLKSDSSRIQLPLSRKHLKRGQPVIEVTIYGRQFSFLWDTGSTENIMSYDLAEELDLVLTDIHFPVVRDRDGYVVRLAAAHTTKIQLGAWRWSNVPWLISDLRILNRTMKKLSSGIDGVLSPQLLLPKSCFSIDREQAVLELFVDPSQCGSFLSKTRVPHKLYEWNGEIYTSVQIQDSPWIGARVETGSGASFLRHDAVRYLPKGTITRSISEFHGEIARSLNKDIAINFGGRQSQISAIEIESSRMTTGHDDLATIGADLLLRKKDRLWVDFSTMSLGFLEEEAVPPSWSDDPGEPRFSLNSANPY